MFEKGGIGDDLPTLALESGEVGEGITLAQLVVRSGLAKSGKDAKRLIAEGGLRVNDAAEADAGRMFAPADLAEPVKLTAQEYKLLSYLLHHKGKVVSRTELIEHIYDQDFDRDSNTIEVFVTRIRKKLGPDVITTIRGLGYSLEEPGA